MQAALLFLLDGWVDFFEDTWGLGNAHLGELLGAIVLVEDIVGVLFEFFHVCADKHLAQLDKVAVFFIVDFDHTPWVSSAAHLAPIGRWDLGISADNREWHLGHDLVVLCNGLFVVELISWTFEDLNIVVGNVGENLKSTVRSNLSISIDLTNPLLEGHHLVISERISLGDNRDKIDLGMQASHDLDIQRFQRVASGLDEINARMYAVVHNVHAVDLVLSVQVCVETLFNVLDNWTPGSIVIDEISKAWRIHNSQSKADTILLDVGAE